MCIVRDKGSYHHLNRLREPNWCPSPVLVRPEIETRQRLWVSECELDGTRPEDADSCCDRDDQNDLAQLRVVFVC